MSHFQTQTSGQSENEIRMFQATNGSDSDNSSDDDDATDITNNDSGQDNNDHDRISRLKTRLQTEIEANAQLKSALKTATEATEEQQRFKEWEEADKHESQIKCKELSKKIKQMAHTIKTLQYDLSWHDTELLEMRDKEDAWHATSTKMREEIKKQTARATKYTKLKNDSNTKNKQIKDLRRTVNEEEETARKTHTNNTVQTQTAAIELVKSNERASDLSNEQIKAIVLPMMKFIGLRVHAELTNNYKVVRKVIATPKSSLCQMINKDKYKEHKKLRLMPRWIWDRYVEVIKKAMPEVYDVQIPKKCRKQKGSEMIKKGEYDEEMFEKTITKLFGPEDL